MNPFALYFHAGDSSPLTNNSDYNIAELGLTGVNPLLLCFLNRFSEREEGRGKEEEKEED